MFNTTTFWVFQIMNGLTSLAMVLAPRRFHESMLRAPEPTYLALGFSTIALEMLHNVIRGQGAALLAVSLYLFSLGPSQRSGFLLIGFVCFLSLLAHIATARHHLRSPEVMAALGTIRPMYGIFATNTVMTALAIVGYLG